MDRVDVGVGFLVFLAQIGLGRVVAETTRIGAEHVDRRLALGNPFGELPAGAARGGDAEAVAFVQPEIAQPQAGPTIGPPSGV